jgi:imidazolonepropionase-like amidohydrolase
MTNNVAHSNLAGVVLRAEPGGSSCSQLSNFTSYASLDFGLITMKGITSDLLLQHVTIAGAAFVYINDRLGHINIGCSCSMQVVEGEQIL